MTHAAAKSPESPGATGARVRTAWKLSAALVGGLFLVWVWHWNYNLLGDFYDYSIVTSSGGYLQQGMRPYRDFTTPLQSLTIYVCYAAELIFGHRYLALAYGNLVLGLAYYAAMLRLLNGRLPFPLAVLSAMALCVATFFQHGLLWYNTIAMLLLTLIVWCAALIYRERRLDRGRLILLCALLWLSSMCKVNFHLLGLATASGLLALAFLAAVPADRRTFRWVPLLIGLSGFVLGPATEILVNGTTPGVFFDNVLLGPSRRTNALSGLWDPKLYLDKLSNAYPNNLCTGIYLIGALVFSGCFYSMTGKTASNETQGNSHARGLGSLRWLAPALLVACYFSSLLLTVTNMETQMLTSSYLVIGLVATHLMFGNSIQLSQGGCLNFAIYILSGFFVVAGSVSSHLHSRILYIWNGNETYHPAGGLNPVLRGYFGGVRLTDLAESRLTKAVAFVEQHNLGKEPQKVFWGPGVEILKRVYGSFPRGRLPLWCQMEATVNERDGPRYIKGFEQNNYEWVVTAVWIKEAPTEFRVYLGKNFDVVENDQLLILHRKP